MYLKKINLKNKTALVTGAGKGIGKACAIALAEAGANLIIISRTQKDLDKVSKIIKKFRKLQLPIEFKKQQSDFIIKNNFKNNSIKKNVKKVLEKIL